LPPFRHFVQKSIAPPFHESRNYRRDIAESEETLLRIEEIASQAAIMSGNNTLDINVTNAFGAMYSALDQATRILRKNLYSAEGAD